MPDIYLIVDLLVILSLFGLGAAVLVQNKSLEINRVFVAFVVCIAVWILSNYISNDIDHSPETAVTANYFVFSFSLMAAVCIWRFAILLTEDERAKRVFKYSFPLLIIAIITSFTSLVVADVEVQGPLYAVIFGPFVILYALALFMSIVSAGQILYRNLKHTSGAEHARIRVIFVSLCLSMPLLLLAQFILPTATGWFGLTNVGIFSMLILVFGFYYGVARHKLFDLKLVVVRSLGYIFSLALILGVYAFISTEVSRHLFTRATDATGRNFTTIALVVLAALSFEPVKKFFNRVTNKFFYRDAYDPQHFLDQVNRAVVANVELQDLLQETSNTVTQHIKSSYCVFHLRETAYTPSRVIGEAAVHMKEGDLKRLGELTSSIHHRVIVTDELEDNEELKQLLGKYDISILARLVTTLKYDLEGIGYMLLGPKKSGNPYSKQDINMMRIVANELVIAIENALRFEEIENFNTTLQQKVDDATTRLKRANEKLKAMDETKDEFISMASHQLRTPLTSVKGYLSMVLEGDAGQLNDMQQKLLGQAFTSSQRMVFLIADLLNLSRLRTGKFVIEAQPTNLAELIAGEVAQLKETAAGRSLKLGYAKPDGFPVLMLDETKIRQVVMNFVDNAIYYTPAGGSIEIKLAETPKSVEFTVHDNGIGVPKSEQHHLFNKFYRAKNAQKARPDGTGLGLFMAKKVIVAQGGAIIFSSKEGKGSTFGFSFSKAKLKPPLEKS